MSFQNRLKGFLKMNKPKTVSAVKIICIIAVFVLVISGITALAVRTAYRHIYPLEYTEYIEEYSLAYGVPKELLYATVKTESGFDPNAKSDAGALGLTQITPETFSWLQSKTGEEYAENDLYDPEISIKYCAVFYSLLLNEFEQTETAVAAYHAGRSKVKGWLVNSEYSSDGKTLTKIPSKVTAHYVSKVTKAINIYNNLYEEEI